MKIGIISDTHGRMPGKVLDVFKTVELIIHAGDVGNSHIITELQALAPVEAVYGNTDTFPLVSQLRSAEFFTAADIRFNLVHSIGTHKRYLYDLFKRDKRVDIVIHGHTHRIEDVTYNNVRFINPGSPNLPRGSSHGSVALLTLGEDIKVKFVHL